jgi:hypothetical protein
MARNRINTEAKLIEYTKRRLGFPVVNVEILDDSWNDIVYRAIDQFAYYAYDGTITSTLLVNLDDDIMEYKLPYRTQAVTGFKSTSMYNSFISIPKGYTLAVHPISLNTMDSVSNIDTVAMSTKMAQMSTLQQMFDVEPNWTYNTNNNTLYLLEKPTSSVALLQIEQDYEPLDIDPIFDNKVVKDLAEGYAWLQWANNMGKYSSVLVNGSEINYNDMLSKGNDLVEKATEEVMSLMEPLGISRG